LQSRAQFSRPADCDDAFITSTIRYGEADCIARLFLLKKGRVSAFYKGAYRQAKQSRGAIEAPAFARLSFVERPESSMLSLRSCDMDPVHALPLYSLKALGYRAYLAEIIEKLLPEGEPCPKIFYMVQELWPYLGKDIKNAHFLRAFELKLLRILGYLPQVPDNSPDEIFFDQQNLSFSSVRSKHGLLLSKELMTYCEDLLNFPIAKAPTNGDDKALLAIGRLFQSRLAHLGLLPLKSVAFLKQIASTAK
jgi:DNA repair protein RecO